MVVELPNGIQCVVFDVGETLVDESRYWTDLAIRAGVTPVTLSAVLGSLIERGESHTRLWDALGVSRPQTPASIDTTDLYDDALDCVAAARGAGFSVGIAGNQPAGVEALLLDAGFDADFIASSAAWGVAKPARGFFDRVIAAAQVAPPNILYVGDRVDNDVLPAREAGMRTAFIRRGPWGHIHARRPEAALADIRFDSLDELARIFIADRSQGSPM